MCTKENVIPMTTETKLKETITTPAGVEATLENSILTIKGEKGSLSRAFDHPRVHLTLKGNVITLLCVQSAKRKDKALLGTFQAHINNMIKGVTNGFEYTMKTVFSHFPIKNSVESNYFLIQNFLGERSPRKARILEGVTVDVKDDIVVVSGADKENVGQTVANIERASKVKRRDIRVFQDGVYLISKGG